MTIRIVTDSTADLPASIVQRHNIVVAPAFINIGAISYVDGVDLTRSQFYENLASYDPPPQTAAASSGMFTEMYTQLAADGATEIISIHLANELSGFYNSARLGAISAENISVHVIDSRSISMGLGLQAIAAAKAAAAGSTLPEILALLETMRPKTYVYAAIDTLDFLRRSGRISMAEAGLGTLLRIKPIVQVFDGVVTTVERVRTRKRVPESLLNLLQQRDPITHIAVLHTTALERAQEFVDEIQPYLPTNDAPIIAEVGPGIGSHVGPNGLGFACIVA